MFFAGLTATSILFISGLVLLLQSSFLTGGVVIGSGFAVFLHFAHFYQSRSTSSLEEEQKKKEEDEPIWADCIDCSSLPMPECRLPECQAPDCDCSPDCSP